MSGWSHAWQRADREVAGSGGSLVAQECHDLWIADPVRPAGHHRPPTPPVGMRTHGRAPHGRLGLALGATEAVLEAGAGMERASAERAELWACVDWRHHKIMSIYANL